MECFVEDLLSMNLIRNGLLVKNKECFDIRQTLDFIVSIFQIKAEMKGVSVTHSNHSDLKIPPNYNERGTYQFDLQEIIPMRGTDQTQLPKKLIGDTRCLK